jgi:hypothetical protein
MVIRPFTLYFTKFIYGIDILEFNNFENNRSLFRFVMADGVFCFHIFFIKVCPA